MTVELCACARAMDSSRGTYRETLLQTLAWPVSHPSLNWIDKGVN
jgi:hypothetical protein